jgi:hypothetical protein
VSRTIATSHRLDQRPGGAEAAAQRRGGGVDGNERLTAITGAVLLVLFAAEGVTLLSLGALLYWHFLIGFLLLGPTCLKISSTLYRFTRYYTGNAAYVSKGPPMPLLRMLGPFVVLTSLGVLGSGVALGLAHSSTYAGMPMLFLHKATFVCWAGVMSIHVLVYIWRLPALISGDVRRTGTHGALTTIGGRGLSWSITAAALAAGTIAALAGQHLSAAWQR